MRRSAAERGQVRVEAADRAVDAIEGRDFDLGVAVGALPGDHLEFLPDAAYRLAGGTPMHSVCPS